MESLCQHTLDGLTAHIAIINQKGTIEAVNAAWRRFAAENGGSSAVVEGASYLRVCDAAQGEDAGTARAFATAIRKVLAGRQRYFEAEYPCHSPEERRWFLGRVTRMPGGGPPRVIVAHTNITKRKTMEEAVRAERCLLESIINSEEAIVLSVDRKYRYTSFNRVHAETMRAMYGSRIARGQSLLEAITVLRDRRIAKRHLDRTLAGEDFSEEPETGNLQRGRRQFAITYRAIRDESGQVTGAAVMARDITVQRQAEKALRESEERHRLILEHAGMGIGYYSPDGRLLLFNTLAAQHMGGVPADFHGRVLEELYGASWAALIRKRIRAAMGKGETPQYYEDRVALPTGEKWFLTNYTKVTDGEGRVAGVQIVSTEITDRKRAEEALRQQQSVLAHLSRVASTGELTTAIAHELNQPLGASLLYAETFRELMRKAGGHDSALVKMMGKLVGELERARQIIGRIREFTRKRRLARSILDVSELLRDAVRLLEHELRLARVGVRYTLRPKRILMYADRVFLQQVLVNLILNALESMVENKKRARELTLGAARSAGGMCTISVTDTGKGLAPGLEVRAFDAFTTTKRQGLGLGLSMSRTIVEEHGGRIWHEAAPSGGAVFRFTIPAAPRKGTHNEEGSEQGVHRR